MSRDRLLSAAATLSLAAVCVAASASPPPKAPASGAALFAANCAACHGPRADGGEGPPLRGIGLTRNQVVAIVTKGFPGEMPAFTALSADQKAQVAAYVAGLKR